MNYTIRPMTREDASQVIDMMRAIHTYHKCGFEVLPYMEMKR